MCARSTEPHLTLVQKYTIYTYSQEKLIFPTDIKNVLYNSQETS